MNASPVMLGWTAINFQLKLRHFKILKLLLNVIVDGRPIVIQN